MLCKICDFSKHRAIRIISTIEKDGGQIFSRMRAGGIGKQKKTFPRSSHFAATASFFHLSVFFSLLSTFARCSFPKMLPLFFSVSFRPKFAHSYLIPRPEQKCTFTLSLEAPCPKLPVKRYLSFPADASRISRIPFKKSSHFLLALEGGESFSKRGTINFAPSPSLN